MKQKITKRCINFLLTLIMVIAIIPSSTIIVLANNEDITNVIHIRTENQLLSIGGSESEGKYYILDNDITLKNEWVPINDFRGTFDGNGHSINNLYITENSNIEFAGLFGKVEAPIDITVTIKNVGVNIGQYGITTGATFAGGLIGVCYSNVGNIVIENCYTTGEIYVNTNFYSNLGGLIGRTETRTSSNTITIFNSYSRCNVFVNTKVYNTFAGGLIGNHHNNALGLKIKNCYATGDVFSSDGGGGLFGINLNDNFFENCYRLSTQSITANRKYENGISLDPKQMQTESSFNNWDFENVWAIDLNINKGYPHLKNNYSTPVITDMIYIKTEEELLAIGGPESKGKYYILDNDITLKNEWVPINDFRGTFNGNGYSINNLYITENSNVEFAGLFGKIEAYIGSVVIIKNVTVNIGELAIETKATYAGGLIGICSSNNGKVVIESCYTTGNIYSNTSSYSNLGGLIGRTETSSSSNTITILDSYSRCNVSANTSNYNTFVGGLIGNHHNNAMGLKVKNCYAIGNVFSYNNAGGLFGMDLNSNLLENCYRISTQLITANKKSETGTVLTPEQIQTKSSFNNWDFENVWIITSNINKGYPHLQNNYSMPDSEQEVNDKTFEPLGNEEAKDLLKFISNVSNNSFINIEEKLPQYYDLLTGKIEDKAEELKLKVSFITYVYFSMDFQLAQENQKVDFGLTYLMKWAEDNQNISIGIFETIEGELKDNLTKILFDDILIPDIINSYNVLQDFMEYSQIAINSIGSILSLVRITEIQYLNAYIKLLEAKEENDEVKIMIWEVNCENITNNASFGGDINKIQKYAKFIFDIERSISE